MNDRIFQYLVIAALVAGGLGAVYAVAMAVRLVV
jgi:hypothetical protein